MNKQTARDNLLIAKSILDKLGVPFFLSNGTALGCHREGDFIEHDSDIDLGVFIEDWCPEILPMMLTEFTLYRKFGKLESGLEYSFFRNEQKLDIFFYYHDGETDYMSVFKRGEEIKYNFPRVTLIDKPFQGTEFKVPTVEYLESQYGQWRTVVEEWDYATSPKNI